MANHCTIHLKKPVKPQVLQDIIKEFCRLRFGDDSMAQEFEDGATINYPTTYGVEASYWIASPKIIEHRHTHDMNFTFSMKAYDYLAWKLQASFTKDEGFSEKVSAHEIFANPTVNLNYKGLEMEGAASKELLAVLNNVVNKLANKNNEPHPFLQEEQYIHPLNRMCGFWYMQPTAEEFEEDTWYKEHHSKFQKRLKEIEKNFDINAMDCFYGNPLRSALSNSNYAVANFLIEKGMPVQDKLDLSSVKKPDYLSPQYIEQMNMPLICLFALCTESNQKNPQDMLSTLLQHGASPLMQDYRGLDGVDCILINNAIVKDKKAKLIQVLSHYVDTSTLQKKIEQHTTQKQKELLLNTLLQLNNSPEKTVIPTRKLK